MSRNFVDGAGRPSRRSGENVVTVVIVVIDHENVSFHGDDAYGSSSPVVTRRHCVVTRNREIR